MHEILNNIFKYTFGDKSEILSYDIISNGSRNITIKIICDQYEGPLFIKIEKDFNVPRTQKFQIAREVAGIILCKEKGINIPNIVNSDISGSMFGKPWILEDFINDRRISECTINDENRHTLGIEFENVFSKLLTIESNYYGDTFDNGIIGKYETWIETISKITLLLFVDCETMNVFSDSSRKIVEQALIKALFSIKCITKPVFYHSDLFSQNVFAKENNHEIHIGTIFDFGMSLFAPIHFVQYQTRMFTDFEIKEKNICNIYGTDKSELLAYDILRIESILMLNLIRFHDTKTDYLSLTNQYVDKCKLYLTH